MSTTSLPRERFLDDPRMRTVAIVGASVLLGIAFAFWDGFVNEPNGFFARWFDPDRQEMSHAWLLPLISGWMLYERRDALARSVGAPSLLAFVPIAGSLFLVLLGSISEVPFLYHVGLVALIVSLPLLFGGWSLFWLCLIPLAYLAFIIPPPFWAVTVLTGQFQLWSSELGVAALRAMGGTVYLTGNVIQLPNATLQVVEACAGLNYLFPLLSLGALAAYFYKGPMWQRLVVFLSTIPITIAMNSLRIAVTGWLVENYGSQHTEGALHFFEGWVVFVMCLGVLLLVIWVFTLMRGERSPFAFFGFEAVAPKRPTGTWTQAAFLRNGIVLTVALLVVGVIANTVGTQALIIPERQDFSTLAFEFPDLKSQESPLSEGVDRALAADDVIVVNFIDEDAARAGGPAPWTNVYIAYLESLQGDGTWHSPRQCLPGGGWEITEHAIVDAPAPDGTSYEANRMVIEADDQRMLVYYWYDQRGRRMADEFEMKLTVLWDSMVRQRSDGAMVRVMTQVAPGESMDEAEARLDEMRMRLLDVLPAYVPA